MFFKSAGDGSVGGVSEADWMKFLSVTFTENVVQLCSNCPNCSVLANLLSSSRCLRAHTFFSSSSSSSSRSSFVVFKGSLLQSLLVPTKRKLTGPSVLAASENTSDRSVSRRNLAHPAASLAPAKRKRF